MKNTVILKGNRYGLSIVLDEKADFSNIISDLVTRLGNAEKFFDCSKQLAVNFEGRKLTNDELDCILTTIEEHSQLNIQYVIEDDSELETTFYDIIHSEANESNEANAQERNEESCKDGWNEYTIEAVTPKATEDIYPQQEDVAMFYKGILRSGQSLEAKNSLVIIGDVNPGATVIAGGNIIIIGTLKGSAIAGANGSKDSFVMALDMNPIQIQIANVIARNSDQHSDIKTQREAMVAKLEQEQIMIEPVSRMMLH